MKKEKKSNPIIELLKKRSLTLYLLLIILLLITGTSAWMVYSNTVSTAIDVHVKSWNIEFTNDIPEVISDDYTIEATDVYPGMTEFTSGINIVNSGDLKATLSYLILSVQLFDNTIEYTREGAERAGLPYSESRLTSEQMAERLRNDYPFSIDFELTNPTFEEIEEESKARLTTSITWPYERENYTFPQKITAAQACSCGTTCEILESDSSHACYDSECGSNTCYINKTLELADEEDTYWGKKAYEYNQGQVTPRASIKLNVILKANQEV